MINQPLPFEEKDGKIILTGPVLLSCGCGSTNARWNTISQFLPERIPHGKPRSSSIIQRWIRQEKLDWPELKRHTYGIVVGETENGLEYVDITGGATNQVTLRVKKLIEESKHAEHDN